MRCVSHRCEAERVDGSRFCAVHRDFLTNLRTNLNEDARTRFRTPPGPLPTRQCDMPGCREPAKAREPYCVRHLQILERRVSSQT